MTRAQRASQANPLFGEPGQQTTFTAFPEGTLLEAGKVPIAEIAELALREGQCTNPIYRVHRWFARRLGSQFRAILAGLSLKPEETDRFWDLYLGDLSRCGRARSLRGRRHQPCRGRALWCPRDWVRHRSCCHIHHAL